jgi:ABC-type transport system involved in multi-copper enzyme maturation permease subunit
MKPVLLIGLNFLRTQWLVVTVMAAYMVLISGFFSLHEQRQEIVFYLQIHATYMVFLAMVVAVSAIHTERRTRRILAVLSKGIERWEYLGGLLLGSAMLSAILCALLQVITTWMCRRTGIPEQGLAALVLDIFLVSVGAAAVALFYSVFLHPLLATAATSVTLTLPFVLGAAYAPASQLLFPVVGLANDVQKFNFLPFSNAGRLAVSGMVWIVIFWAGASAIFARRDVTISPE